MRERATDMDLKCFRTAYVALVDACESDRVSACLHADVVFHQAIADASHNSLIGHLWARLMRVIHGHASDNQVHLRTLSRQWEQLHAQRKAIWEALRQRDPKAAMRTSRDHIHFVREVMAEAANVEERRNSALRRLS